MNRSRGQVGYAHTEHLRCLLEREVLDPGAVREAFNEIWREVVPTSR